MVALPKVQEEKDAIWDLTQHYLEEMIEKGLDCKPADTIEDMGERTAGTQAGRGGDGGQSTATHSNALSVYVLISNSWDD